VAEQEVVSYLVLRIPSYGQPEKLERDHLEALTREAAMRYGKGAMVGDLNGKWWRHDTDRRDGDHLVECYPPDLRIGQKPFKPKPLKKVRPEALADVIHMNGNASEVSKGQGELW
jgi:hypothetical protein